MKKNEYRRWFLLCLIFTVNCHAIQLVLSGDTHVLKVQPDDWTEPLYLQALIFCIEGDEFGEINGNYRDSRISGKIVNENKLRFIFNSDDSSAVYEPAKQFKYHFFQLIRQGLCAMCHLNPRLEASTAEALPLHDSKKRQMPSCFEFASYLTTGNPYSICAINKSECIPVEDKINIPAFSVLSFFQGEENIHEAIYIGQGVCMNKLGAGKVYFHHLSDVIDFYQQMTGVQLEVMFSINNLSPSGSKACPVDGARPPL
ncbi:hypothetical protein [Spongorhabdus nitratireducens]